MKRKLVKFELENITFDTGYDEFIMYCKSRNLRPATIEHYDNTINIIYKCIPPKTPIGSITSDTVDKFILWCKTTLKIKDITIHTYLRGLKTVLYYFMKMGYMEKFHIEMIKYDKPVIEVYTEQEVKILLKKPNKKKCSFATYRDWVICNVLYGTGMRSSNIRSLKIADIDFYNNLISLKTTKNRKPLVIPITKALQPILKEYLAIRKGNNEDYVFCTVYGDKLKRETLNNTMMEYNKSRGVVKTGIHRWRHTFAKQWILNHGDILKLQKILNHSNLDMVKNYVNIFTNDLQEDMEQFNPLEFVNKKTIKMK